MLDSNPRLTGLSIILVNGKIRHFKILWSIKPTLCIRKFEGRIRGFQILEDMRQKVSSSNFYI